MTANCYKCALICWEPRGVLVFSKLMLLLTMEACPPPTLGLRPRRDLPACVRTRPHTCSRGKTYGAILSGLTPREGPSGIVEYCVIGHTPTSPQPGLSVCSDAFGSGWFRSGGDRGRRRQCDGGSVAEDEVAVGGATRRTKVPDRGDFNCSSSGPWAAGSVPESGCRRGRGRQFGRIAIPMDAVSSVVGGGLRGR